VTERIPNLKGKMNTRFKDRTEGGQALAEKLAHYSERSDVVVLALPRGGVPVGYEVATRVKAPLEVFLVRKLGVPGHEEFAMGAIASGGLWFVNEEVVRQLGISRRQIQQIVDREEQEMERRMEVYGPEFSKAEVRGQVVILVDDGLATGSTMRAAVAALKQKHPQRIVVGVPVASAQTCEELHGEVDEIICVNTPEDFYAVGQWYEDFSQTSDDEVRELLNRAKEQFEPAPIPPWPAAF
jgi:putative phosphoribosyl transferase